MKFLKYIKKTGEYDILYTDETGFDKYLYRERGLVKKGEKVFGKILGRKFQRRTSLVAGLIDNEFFVSMIYKDTMKSDLFEEWFERMLIP